MSGVPCSAALVPYWRAIEAWTLAVKRHKIKGTNRKIKSKFWTRTLKNAGLKKTMKDSLILVYVKENLIEHGDGTTKKKTKEIIIDLHILRALPTAEHEKMKQKLPLK